jgi:PKD repeat protein
VRFNQALFLVIGIFALPPALAQNPIADFTLAATACRNQNLFLQNNSSNADTFNWDFCLDDFSASPSTVNIAFAPGFGQSQGYKLIKDGVNWFGFMTSQSKQKMYRLDFGSDPTNTPTITDLGNPGGLLIFPEGIDIIKANGNWYGFVGSLEFSFDAGIIRLDFGSSLSNTPTAVNIGNFGYNTRFRDLKVIKEGPDFILVLMSYNSNSIIRINYRNGFGNLINGSHIFDSGTITGASLPMGFDIAYRGSDLIMLVASKNSNSILQLNFGTSILNVPTVEGNYSISGVTQPYKVKLVQEGNDFFAVVGNESTSIQIINFYDLNPINVPLGLTHSALPVLLGLEIFRWKGKSLVQAASTTDDNFKKLTFESICDAVQTFAEDFEPEHFFYTQAGEKKIELVAINSSTDEQSIIAKKVTISSFVAPDITFTSANICVNHDVNFTSINTSSDIINYSWFFGDTHTSTDPNPTYQYTSSGDYRVKLQVVSNNGCQNFDEKPIKIYNSPSSSFILPSSPLICTNNEFTFTNTTTGNFDGNLTYQWYIDNNLTATTRDLKYTFISGGNKDIKLKAAIPGCFNESTQTIIGVQTGPVVDFSISGKCETEVVSFTNNSSGSIAGYSWNFGNGSTSSSISPTQIFSNKGIYPVSLQTTGVNGCVSTLSKNLTIYSKPQPNFSLNLPPFSCAGSLSQFTNSTPTLTDSNISSWSWNFGDAANGTSIIRDPGYKYLVAGDYTVSLLAKTNFGCEATLQKSVTVSPSPVASFTNAAACLNQGTKFIDGSGASIKSWLWTIDASTYSFNNPTHVFSANGSHSVSLAVTGNNNCISTISKTLNVPVPVSINFSTQNLCEDQTTTFQDNTPTNSDGPAIWSWDVGGLATKTGASTTYAFSESGTYPVKLSSTRQSGCIYSVTKNVTITATPVAKFSPTPEWGTPPLSVQFQNESTGATTYQWKFNDKNNSTSALLSPSFQFNEVGEYVIDLTATSTQGCSNTFSNKVSVVIPSLDVDLRELTLIKDEASGAYQMMVTIKNLSNYPLDKINVLVFISGNATIRETINARIIPNGEVTRLLSNQILPGASTLYLCAELDVVNDRDELNNKKCEPLDAKPVIFSPYPNPSAGSFQFDWIAAEKEDAYFEILNSMGQTVLQQSVTATQKGLNQIQVDLRSLSAGTFYFKFISGSVSRTLPISIVR